MEQSGSPFALDCRPGQVLRIPISHGEGNFYADPQTLDGLEAGARVLFRYCTPDGRVIPDANPNGSLNNIAGITNARGNVLGMMPHPERACESLLGSEDGLAHYLGHIGDLDQGSPLLAELPQEISLSRHDSQGDLRLVVGQGLQ